MADAKPKLSEIILTRAKVRWAKNAAEDARQEAERLGQAKKRRSDKMRRAAQIRWANATAEERAAQGSCFHRNMTPEQISARVRKSWEKRRQVA